MKENYKKLSDLLTINKSEGRPFLITRTIGKEPMLASSDAKHQGSFQFVSYNRNVKVSLENVRLIPLNEIGEYSPFGKIPKVNINRPATTNKTEFQNTVHCAVEEIRNGRLKKVVLSKAKMISIQIDPITTFLNLAKEYPNSMTYCFYHPICGLWIGASPEKLIFEINPNNFLTHSLAGTKRVNGEWSSKEIEEQKIVTDYILKRLLDRGQKVTSIEGPKDHIYGSIKHLKSDIYVESNYKIDDIAKILHPTPAICGMPLDKAQQFIAKNEKYERSFYTGYLGYSNLNGIQDAHFVNLRCMQVFTDTTYIYTGAGIVEGSDPQSEWEEVELKAASVIKCLADL